MTTATATVKPVRWELPALLGLLALTAVLYIWDLGASGWANSFYSAAVQAGSTNWVAFFYGSSDAANSITVDKPPASLWLMALSARVFGLSAWSILLPEALMGVATVGVVYATVRRAFSAKTALLAGGILALTPVAALMFRFNNPDALLVLLTALATYFTVRGIQSGRIRWVLWAGTMVGFAFLTKQLQAFLILPALAGVYLVAAPGTWGKRVRHLFAALGAVVVSAGWWVAIVELVPSTMRPYIGGSQTNSFLELTFGYNGLGRLTGNETGSVTGGVTGGMGTSMWGSTGILRLFTGEIGGQITWLLPAALVLMVVGLWLLRTLPRMDLRRAILLMFSAWLLVTAIAFSFMAGIFHAYYTVALAPALAAVTAIGATLLWAERDHLWARLVAAAVVVGSASWSWVLLAEAPTWLPWLKFVVAGFGLIAAGMLVVSPRPGRGGRRFNATTIAVALAALLLGPAAWTVDTILTPHTGSIVTAGPAVASGTGGPGGPGIPGAGGPGAGSPGVGGPGGAGGGAGAFPGNAGGAPSQGAGQGARQGAGNGGMGGLLGGGTVGTAVTKLLTTNATQYTWVAAAIGSQTAAGYQLASGESVMPIGGFNGSDPSPTLAEFQAYVKAGAIHYFIAGSAGAPNGGSTDSSSITAWVEANFTAQTVDGVTLYDLTSTT